MSMGERVRGGIRMRVGLIDVDGHNFPNLALMRISAWHKAQGDQVEWWLGDLFHYDVVYKSKVFSDAYSKDTPDPLNCDKVIKGGTGYYISLHGGVECFDAVHHETLPPEMEKMFPDYSIYPQFQFAVAMTSRGCPRGCAFCHVAAKEGKRSARVASVSDFWNGQKEIQVLDPNITACPDKHELFKQYAETGASVCFNQGLDIRCITDSDIDDLNKIKLTKVHFAWDNPKDDLAERFEEYAKKSKHKYKGSYGMVYVLTNFNSSMEDNLRRIYKLAELHYDPYVMVYNKPDAPKEIRNLQRWCNNKIIFKKCPDFYDYDRKKG